MATSSESHVFENGLCLSKGTSLLSKDLVYGADVSSAKSQPAAFTQIAVGALSCIKREHFFEKSSGVKWVYS